MKKYFLHRIMIIVMMIIVNSAAYAQWTINESFEGGVIPSGWTIVDANGDNMTFKASNKPAYAHTGNWIAMVEAYTTTGHDWLITPQVTIHAGDKISFFARAWYGVENMNVKLSTTGNAVGNFTVNLANVVGFGTSYQEYTYDLSAYAGQNIYLAVEWLRGDYALVIDDVKVGQPQPNDVGILTNNSPIRYTLVNNTVIPVATVKNFGSTAVADDFPVTCNISDNQNNIVYTATRTFTKNLAAGQTDTIHFAGWNPATPGTFNVTTHTQLAGDAYTPNDIFVSSTEVVAHYGTGGPDLMSYRWIDSSEPGGPAYNWIDISATGISTIMYGVDAFAGDDNFSEPIALGFEFPFYGVKRSYFNADINGTLLLTGNNWYKPFPDWGWYDDGNMFNYMYKVPGYHGMPALVSVLWDDLLAVEGAGNVYFQTFGTSPDKYCVIQWNNLQFVSGTQGSPTLCFEVILHENGDIVMQYKNVANGQTGGAMPHDFAQSSTIGIQNDYFSAGLGYLNEIAQNGTYIGPDPAGNLLHNEMAIKFYVGEDHEVPMFVHSKIWNTFNTYSDFTATINDISGISTDTLYYNSGSGWKSVTHASFEEPNIYHYSIKDLPLGSTVDYYLAATDNSANHNRGILNEESGTALSFKILPTDGTRILVLSPGNKAGFSDYQNLELPKYTTALDNAGVTYDVYNFAAYPQYSIPKAYDKIFAYANIPQHNATYDTLSKALMNFMDSGTEAMPKNLFFASADLPSAEWALSNDSPFRKFFTAYLRASFEVQPNPPIYGGEDGIGGPDFSGYQLGSIIGMANSPIGIQNIEIPVYADSPDVIFPQACPETYNNEVSNPAISSKKSFNFQDGPISGNAYSKGNCSAVWLDNLIYKSFYISFDISQMSRVADINATIHQALVWFSPLAYDITVSANPAEAGNVTGGGSYVMGSTAIIEAIPNTGYSFVNWSVDGNIVSSSAQYTFSVNANQSLIAHFEPASYTITTSAQPAEGGAVTGNGSYLAGSDVTITATPATGYYFASWIENGTIISSENPYTFAVNNNRTIVADFKINVGTSNIGVNAITISPNPAGDHVLINLNNNPVSRIDLYNSTGCVTSIENINGISKQMLDLSSYSKGIYFVRVTFENGNYKIFKVVHI